MLTNNKLLLIVTDHELDPDPPALQLNLQSVSNLLAFGQKHQACHLCCPESEGDVMNLQPALNTPVQTHKVVATELDGGGTLNIIRVFNFFISLSICCIFSLTPFFVL